MYLLVEKNTIQYFVSSKQAPVLDKRTVQQHNCVCTKPFAMQTYVVLFFLLYVEVKIPILDAKDEKDVCQKNIKKSCK